MRTHLDLFSGIGGFALAAQWNGLETIGFSEVEPYACQILKRHWPTVPNYGDIRNIRGVRADLVTGGFPCQPFSLAGKRRGASDDRALWPEMLRVIEDARPTWVLGENVPGIITLELDRVLADLEGIGYACWPLCVPACAVDARHRRDRVWIVAHAQSRGGNGPIQSSKRQTIPVPIRPSEAVADAEGLRRQGEREPGQQITGGLAEEGLPDWGREESRAAEWLPEPELGRVAHGIPHRSHRLRGLGNAIVPQVAAEIIRMMLAAEAEFSRDSRLGNGSRGTPKPSLSTSLITH